MARSLSAVLWLCVLSSPIAGCDRSEPQSTPQKPEIQQTAIDCHKQPFADSAACRDGGAGVPRGETIGPNPFYKDRGDKGDDPRRAGCHESFTAPRCREDGEEFEGDTCLDDGDTLIEYTSRVCHTRDDRKIYHCDQYCKSVGFAAGSCRKVRDEVCPPNGSAECKCTGKD
jgi:hypothetical protein